MERTDSLTVACAAINRLCRRLAASGLLLLTAACAGGGGSGGPADVGVEPELKGLDVSLVDSSAAAPAWVAGTCVIFAPRLNAVELLVYWLDPALSVMTHIGQSMQDCIDGKAQPYVASWDAFFEQTVWIDRDGDCPNGVSCYWPNSAVIMLDPPAIATRERPEDFIASLLGHELYHAVAGYYHP